jgi:type IV pilus assembly protein PilX
MNRHRSLDIFRKPLAVANNERGAVLITGLFLLVVITLIGVIGMSKSTLQERMSANTMNRSLAFDAAELGLREGEAFLGAATLPAFDGTNGLYATDATLWQNDATWTGTNSVVFGGALGGTEGGTPAEAPRYYIEDMGPLESSTGSLTGGTQVSKDQLLRVTARGVGGTGTSEVILQTSFVR